MVEGRTDHVDWGSVDVPAGLGRCVAVPVWPSQRVADSPVTHQVDVRDDELADIDADELAGFPVGRERALSPEFGDGPPREFRVGDAVVGTLLAVEVERTAPGITDARPGAVSHPIGVEEVSHLAQVPHPPSGVPGQSQFLQGVGGPTAPVGHSDDSSHSPV
ncbi:hypothetical protein [Halorientalis sp.]|uniref:hypothetical protein n=1 Tax=Halorientalis sp. TaxID=1931229 RepID=UPI0026062F0F|nr:hypothetical protein [Halorientalis sp.]